MKKKTYKQMQNQLYREIKRRMLLESIPLLPLPKIHVEQHNVETLKLMSRIDKMFYDSVIINKAKQEMGAAMTDRLINDGYICFENRPDLETPEYYAIEARLNVVRSGVE